jgi:hypothetical protein
MNSISDLSKYCAENSHISDIKFSFAIGGHDGVSHLNSVECFDIEQGVWTQVAPLATARRGMAVGALGNAIYAVGGLDDTVCYKVRLFLFYIISNKL